jgi:hypothetical protein
MIVITHKRFMALGTEFFFFLKRNMLWLAPPAKSVVDVFHNVLCTWSSQSLIIAAAVATTESQAKRLTRRRRLIFYYYFSTERPGDIIIVFVIYRHFSSYNLHIFPCISHGNSRFITTRRLCCCRSLKMEMYTWNVCICEYARAL